MRITLNEEAEFYASDKELSCEAAMSFGRAVGSVLCRSGRGNILVGRDTRRSAAAYGSAVSAGILSSGADVTDIGVVPRAAGAFTAKKLKADGFVMIGEADRKADFCCFTVYGSSGVRASRDICEKINKELSQPSLSDKGFGRFQEKNDSVSEYISFILRNCGSGLSGMSIAADCANGSVSAAAEELFSALGAKVYLLNCDPDGDNVNRECGLSSMEALCEFVTRKKCDFGVAFDAEGAKCLAVDEKGMQIDGERLTALFAVDMKERDSLANNGVVISASANLGFSVFAEKNGIKAVSTKSGGRYIIEKMTAGHYSLGGEQSGNIIFGAISRESDGLLTAVKLISAVSRSGKKLSQLCSVMEKYPQVAINVKIPDRWRENWKNIPELEEFIESRENELGASGRIVVREKPSEPVIRVSVEGRHFDAVNSMALQIAEAVKRFCPTG